MHGLRWFNFPRAVVIKFTTEWYSRHQTLIADIGWLNKTYYL